MRDPLTICGKGQTNGANGAVEWDTGKAECRRCAIDGDDIVRIDEVGCKHGANNMHLVTEAVGEARTQRAVHKTASEDGLVGRLAFTTEERTGDTASGVHALFDIDGEWEEVGTFTGALCRSSGHEHDGVANADGDCTVGLTGKFAGRKGNGLVGIAGNGGVDGNGISHVCLLCETDIGPSVGGDPVTSSQR